MNAARAIALFALAAGCASCGGGDDVPSSFHIAQERWQAKAPTSYTFTLTWHGQIGTRHQRVVVHDGRVVTPSPGPSPGRFGSDVGTIDQMMDALEHDFRTADKVTATYDETWGFPTSVEVDEYVHGQDDEFGYGVSNFAAR